MSGDESDSSGIFGVPVWAVAVVAVIGLVMVALIGGTTLLVVIGATLDDGESASSGAGVSNAAIAAEDGTPVPATATPKPEASTPEPESESAYAIRIRYDGSWQGAVSLTGGDGTTESISGSGTTTIEVTGQPDIISANAQKQDDSTARLTVQILHEGDVVAEASTTAGYGLAQVSESFY